MGCRCKCHPKWGKSSYCYYTDPDPAVANDGGKQCQKSCNNCEEGCDPTTGICKDDPLGGPLCRRTFWGAKCENKCDEGCRPFCNAVDGSCQCEDVKKFTKENDTKKCTRECENCKI